MDRRKESDEEHANRVSTVRKSSLFQLDRRRYVYGPNTNPRETQRMNASSENTTSATASTICTKIRLLADNCAPGPSIIRAHMVRTIKTKTLYSNHLLDTMLCTPVRKELCVGKQHMDVPYRSRHLGSGFSSTGRVSSSADISRPRCCLSTISTKCGWVSDSSKVLPSWLSGSSPGPPPDRSARAVWSARPPRPSSAVELGRISGLKSSS